MRWVLPKYLLQKLIWERAAAVIQVIRDSPCFTPKSSFICVRCLSPYFFPVIRSKQRQAPHKSLSSTLSTRGFLKDGKSAPFHFFLRLPWYSREASVPIVPKKGLLELSLRQCHLLCVRVTAAETPLGAFPTKHHRVWQRAPSCYEVPSVLRLCWRWSSCLFLMCFTVLSWFPGVKDDTAFLCHWYFLMLFVMFYRWIIFGIWQCDHLPRHSAPKKIKLWLQVCD